MTTPPRYLAADRLAVEIHPDRRSLGQAAARHVAAYLHDALSSQENVRVIFACAPSQDEFLSSLVDPAVCGRRLEWSRITAFHMDEYVGLSAERSQSFRHYLRTHLLGRVPVGAFHPLPGEAPDRTETCRRYAALLEERPIDLVCMGIGENGHIAFNDPPVADFDDPVAVKEVELDRTCREQQVNDGCFPSFEAVPTHALTLTVPVFRRARRLSVHAPGPRKAQAAKATVFGPISTRCPASILRLHASATLYLDADSAGLLQPS